jgi:hypothetical protein
MPYCKECNKKLLAGDKFCPSCGTPVSVGEISSDVKTRQVGLDASTRAVRGTRLSLWQICLAVLAVVGITFFIFVAAVGVVLEGSVAGLWVLVVLIAILFFIVYRLSKMQLRAEHTMLGIVSFMLGIMAFITGLLPIFIAVGVAYPLMQAVLAIVFGAVSYWGKQKDSLGLTGFIFGIIGIIFNLIIFFYLVWI